MEADDTTSQFMVDLTNNYLTYFKKINGKPQELNMFDGINIDDETSVNHQTESFYEEMVKYQMASDTDKEVYKYDELPNLEDDDELYSIQCEGEQIVVSKSLFSLLIELTNLQNENPKKKYDIICLS
jgi:hypothetical protein